MPEPPDIAASARAEAEPDNTVAANTSANSPATGDHVRDELAALRERVAQLERELEGERDHGTDYMRRWQQAQADLANFRRRAQQEQEQFVNLAAARAMELVLPALDSFERAFNSLPDSLQHLTWIEGIALVDFQLRRALEMHGVTPFEPKPGEPLDPARHQAIAQAETTAHPDGAILDVVQRGYELRGRALRPALVRVARAPATAGPPGEGAGPGDSAQEALEGSGPAPPDPTASAQ